MAENTKSYQIVVPMTGAVTLRIQTGKEITTEREAHNAFMEAWERSGFRVSILDETNSEAPRDEVGVVTARLQQNVMPGNALRLTHTDIVWDEIEE